MDEMAESATRTVAARSLAAFQEAAGERTVLRVDGSSIISDPAGGIAEYGSHPWVFRGIGGIGHGGGAGGFNRRPKVHAGFFLADEPGNYNASRAGLLQAVFDDPDNFLANSFGGAYAQSSFDAMRAIGYDRAVLMWIWGRSNPAVGGYACGTAVPELGAYSVGCDPINQPIHEALAGTGYSTRLAAALTSRRSAWTDIGAYGGMAASTADTSNAGLGAHTALADALNLTSIFDASAVPDPSLNPPHYLLTQYRFNRGFRYIEEGFSYKHASLAPWAYYRGGGFETYGTAFTYALANPTLVNSRADYHAARQKVYVWIPLAVGDVTARTAAAVEVALLGYNPIVDVLAYSTAQAVALLLQTEAAADTYMGVG
jgi:hypothetical protein